MPTIVGGSVLGAEIRSADEKYGPFRNDGGLDAARLALACIGDEFEEAMEAYRTEREADDWAETGRELIQVAATAMRAYRDIFDRPRKPRPG